ncbi:MAG: glutathione-dependent formaldehyde dehydrogenase [Actinomycetota bacterium]|nr:glutathione-dependent formaldehyde dehydrogenase [Actinomycetota bacterium]
MKAIAWHGKRDVRVDNVPDPTIQESTDAVIRITTTNICGSDLHLYEVLGAFIDEGYVLGHEPMGIVEEVGRDVTQVSPGDRVVIPFNISCGHCFMCHQDLHSQCETTQVHEQGMGASLFGFAKLYGDVPGGQAEFLRVPQAQFTPIKIPEEGEGMPDERFVYLSDVLPTSWQAVEYAGVPEGGSVAIYGLGPIGQMSARIARYKGYKVIAVDFVPERLQMARDHGIEVVDASSTDDVPSAIREMTDGRGPDSVIDAVGMEAHGSPAANLAQQATGLLPDRVAQSALKNVGVDRLEALNQSIDTVRRGGTLSLIGLYGGTADPINMLKLFDKQIQIRMGQANVKAWVDDIMPLLVDPADPLGVESFATHKLPLDQAPHGYEIFQKKQDGAIKILLQP